MKPLGVSLVLVFALTLAAQVPGPVPSPIPGPAPFPTALRLYLELTSTQEETIRNLNADYNRLAATKMRRANQVQQEIIEETAKEPLDPMALGLRYAEIESIRRQLAQELERTRAKVRAALTEPQRGKLKILEDALKLLPLYSEAVGVNLLEWSVGFGVMPMGGVTVPAGVSVPVPDPGQP